MEVANTSFPFIQMFKSKTDFNAFDKHHTKVPNIDIKKLKGLTKNGTKKLVANPEVQTAYHLVLDYFEDPAGKPAGHFLDFGTNKKLTKHFEQVELKSGKLDKRMSANQKEASMGAVYVKEENSKNILHFEPDPSCKVPKGKWPKILKALKPFINSMKAVVVLNGEVVGEATEETAQDSAADSTQLISLDALKTMFKPISVMLKTTLREEIIPRIKAKTATDQDAAAVATLQEQITAFLEAYPKSEEATQTTLAKAKATLEEKVPFVEKIATALEGSVGTTASDDPDTAAAPPSAEEAAQLKKLEEMLADAEKGLNDFEEVYKRLVSEVETPTAPMPGGNAFLAGLGV